MLQRGGCSAHTLNMLVKQSHEGTTHKRAAYSQQCGYYSLTGRWGLQIPQSMPLPQPTLLRVTAA